MSRPLAICALLLVLCGCASKSDPAQLARQSALEVTPVTFLVSDLPDDERRRLGVLLERSLERSLLARGYESVPEGRGAPSVRSSWVRDAGESAGRGEPVIAISFSVFATDGSRLFTARSVRALPLRAWTESRVDAEVGHLMRGFPERRP